MPNSPGAAGTVSPRVDVMHDALAFAHLLIEARTASAAEQHGKHVQHRHIRMAQFGNVPGEMQMAQFDGRFLDDFARRGLLRFGGRTMGGNARDLVCA